MIESGGTGRAWVKINNGRDVEIASDGSARVTVTANETTLSNDVTAAGGFRMPLVFTHGKTLQNQRTLMTSSVTVVSSSVANSPDRFMTRIPVDRAGSVVGLSLWSYDGIITAGALTASVTIDGAVPSTTALLIMTTGSNKATTYSKDATVFSSSQQIGVSLSASADYLNTIAASASWMASVVIEC